MCFASTSQKIGGNGWQRETHHPWSEPGQYNIINIMCRPRSRNNGPSLSESPILAMCSLSIHIGGVLSPSWTRFREGRARSNRNWYEEKAAILTKSTALDAQLSYGFLNGRQSQCPWNCAHISTCRQFIFLGFRKGLQPFVSFCLFFMKLSAGSLYIGDVIHNAWINLSLLFGFHRSVGTY